VDALVHCSRDRGESDDGDYIDELANK